MTILFWEPSKNISPEDLEQVVRAARCPEIDEYFVSAGVEKLPSGFMHTNVRDVYHLADTQPDATIIRLREGGEPIPPKLISKMLAKHENEGAAYTYTDGFDAGRAICVEIASPKALASALRGGFYPDGSLAMFQLVNAGAYVFDRDDFAFYYRNNFERFYSRPVSINIEPASRCNLKCRMCCYQSEMYDNAPLSSIPRFIEKKLYFRIMDELAALGSPSYVENCYRGEPLLSKELFECLRYASDMGISSSLVTNATLLDSKKSEQLLDSGIDAVTFSVDGATAETYEKIRIGADFNQVTSNIMRFMELANTRTHRPVICIKTCLQEDNRNEITELVTTWIDSADYVIVQNQSFPGDETYKNWYNPESLGRLDGYRPPCHALWRNMLISTTGNTAQCVTVFAERPEEVLGNLYQESVFDIWTGPKFEKRRRLALEGRFGEIPLCRHCDGVSCAAITLGKEMVNNSIFAVKSAGYVMYSSAENRRLYPA